MPSFADRISSLPPKRLALLAHELNEQLSRERSRNQQSLAIIGMACRFPGGADNPETLWRLLLSGSELIVPAPSDRWRVDEPINGLARDDGVLERPRGGFLPHVDQFDPLFFGISPREAEMMDPQQRLLLELAWEALEHAAVAPASLRGSRTGVFIGIAGHDFAQNLLGQELNDLDSYMASGGSNAIAAGRLAYTLDLAGPCVSIDTACSSSLVAISAACDSLRLGRCDLALAGGVSLILSPETSVVLANAGMLSRSFRCKSFDAEADGFVRGEGGGIVVLKRLADAERDSDPVIAVIRGTAVNQDGRSSSLTAPSGPAQSALLRDALADGELMPSQVQYVEAHGTGTRLGDPIEANALAAVFGPDRPQGDPLWLGSIKANFGHLEAAAGVAGLIKLALCLQHGTIPPLAGLTSPNPLVDWADMPLALPTQLTPWPGPPSGRVGGVSSFGFSGTNAHLVLSAAGLPAPAPSGHDRSHHLLCLSAKSRDALRVLANRYAETLSRQPDVAMADVCGTANTGRDHHPVRLAIVSQSVAELRLRLSEAAATPAAGTKDNDARNAATPQVAFLFTGQGSQYFGMSRGLYEAEPAFAATIDLCDEILSGIWDQGLKALLFTDSANGAARLDQTGFTQPALFSVEVALAELLMSWGIRPAAALGHSVGEYAAACAAGVLSLEDGLRLISERGRLMQSLPPGGGMVAVLADEAVVRRAIASFPSLSVAALNGPGNHVVSGPLHDLARVTRHLSESGALTQELAVSHAFHSALLDPMLSELERAAGAIPYGDAKFPVVSNVTGRIAVGDDMRSGSYWRDHARKPVRFADGVRTLRALSCNTFVEIGPAPILSGMARRIIDDPDIACLPTLRRGGADVQVLLDCVGALYAKGVNLNFGAMTHGSWQRLRLPTYPFERSRYWPKVKPRIETPRPPATTQEPWRDWLYEPRWRPAPDEAAQHNTPTYIPDTASLKRMIDDHVAVSHRTQLGSDSDQAYGELDRLCHDYIVEALGKLGCELRAGERFSTGALRARLGVIDRHARLFARLLNILAEDGILAGDAAAWHVSRVPERPASQARLANLASAHPDIAAELAVLAPCGANLAEVLRGNENPMRLLFPGGSLDAVSRLYSEPRPVRVFNDLVERCIEAVVARLPTDRHLRVLEIGAGTGGTTGRLLRHLPPDRSAYRFTDVSPHFLDRARDLFGNYDFLDYAIFDLDNPPHGHADWDAGFDIIIAANVVHATRDIRRSLDTVRRLLRPNGLLLLIEVVRPQRMGDLTVGLMEGWWSFTDYDIRPDYALIPRATWTRLLAEAGFTDARSAPEPGAGVNGLLSNQCVLLARRPAQAASAPSATAGQAARGRWLIFNDRGGVGDHLAAKLRARGGDCLIVRPGGTYRHIDDEIEMAPTMAADHARVQRAFVRSDPAACRGVIYLCGLDAVFEDADGPSAVQSCVEAACRPALLAIQAMTEAGWTCGGLTIVTRGGRTTHPTQAPARPAQAALWGMTGVVALEHPEARCRRIELAGGDEAENLLQELLREDPREYQVALTRHGRQLLRLERSAATQDTSPEPPFRANAIYLVTGGLTGLGLETARWLADRGAGQLVLVGRRPPDAQARAAITAIARRGPAPICLQADMGVMEDFDRVFAAIDATGQPLAGVIHSAGVLSDAILSRQDWAGFETVLRAKVQGAWQLHRLTRSRNLDFFVLYSSGAALLGSAGQANHAAANAFMDSLAFHRRAKGLPALSVNWAAWRGVGTAAGHSVLETARRHGVDAIDAQGGLRALGRMIASDNVQTAVLPIDWTRFDDAAPLFSDLKTRPIADPPRWDATAGSASGAWRQILLVSAPDRRISRLRDLLTEQVAKVLKLKPSQSVDPHQPLRELGLDSLMSVELADLFASALAIERSPTIFYHYPTIERLAEHFLHLLSANAPSSPPGPPVEDLDDLSEEELVKRLKEQIE
jgi:acyl transferase domain-containing protein/SAM-dependent methyltransferase/acyl carrier protein